MEMQSISLIKRLLYYILLFGVNLTIGMLFGGVLREYSTIYLVVFVFLIPHYVVGLIFFKTKLIIKLLVPSITTFFSFGSFWLIGVTDMIDSDILFFVLWFLSIVIVWEIAYQILIRCCSGNTTANPTEKSKPPG